MEGLPAGNNQKLEGFFPGAIDTLFWEAPLFNGYCSTTHQVQHEEPSNKPNPSAFPTPWPTGPPQSSSASAHCPLADLQ